MNPRAERIDPHGRTWSVTVEAEQIIMLASGEALDRKSFLEWLWSEEAERGLLGICEGTIDVDEAVARGLVESSRILDAAEAPAERDWMARLPTAVVTCWFDTEAAARAAASRLAGAHGCRVQGIRQEIPHDDGDDWKQSFGPIDVPGFGTIRPAWDEGEAGAGVTGTTVYIEPGAGFGTGLHETTRLCLAALGAWIDGGGAISRVLDFGSGSGILGIAAAVRGAGHVDAVEIDGRVHDAIRANARRNGVAERLRVQSTLPGDEKPYDLVLANIVADVLRAAADELCRRISSVPGAAGGIVLCGLLAADVPGVADRYGRALGSPPVHTTLGEWHCLRFTKAGDAAP